MSPTESPACACLSVVYDPNHHEGGAMSDRWLCHSCGAEFVRWERHSAVVGLVASVENQRNTLRGELSRYKEHLDDIRCDILDAGVALGDDSDQELTPRRLVREVLATRQAYNAACDAMEEADPDSGQPWSPVPPTLAGAIRRLAGNRYVAGFAHAKRLMLEECREIIVAMRTPGRVPENAAAACAGAVAHLVCPAPPRAEPGRDAVRDVLTERAKQRAKWGDAHDDGHGDGALAAVAAVLAHPESPREPCGCREAMCPHVSIVEDPEPIAAPEWALPLRWRHDRRRQLVISAALLLAEIERLDREAGRG